jgi:hypothetical protein
MVNIILESQVAWVSVLAALRIVARKARARLVVHRVEVLEAVVASHRSCLGLQSLISSFN